MILFLLGFAAGSLVIALTIACKMFGGSAINKTIKNELHR